MADNRGSPWFKWFLVLSIIAVIGMALAWRFFGRREAAPEYQVAMVARGDLIQTVTATGQLNPVTNVTVGSQISGIIQTLNADFNSKVKAGQVIAQLDPATYKASVAQAEGEVANAEANLELAKIEFQRAEELLKNKLISQSEYDRTLATLHQAEAQVKIRKGALQRASVDLSRCTIYAPVDGIVISRNVDVGQTVAASLSAPTLFIIANDLTKMQINANVSEADVGAVEPGQQVSFIVDAFPYRTFHGEVVQVRNAPINVQNVVSYDTVISVSNPDMKLKPGMTANVTITTAERQNVIKVPNTALRVRLPEAVSTATTSTGTNAVGSAPTGGGRGEGGGGRRGQRGGAMGGRLRGGERQMTRTVYVLSGDDENARPAPVTVKLGITDGFMTEVVEGLNEGDRVITGVITTAQEPAANAPANPFSGGGRGMRRF